MPLRARKVVRDLVSMRGRVALMVLAIAAGAGAVGTVLGARAILEREIRVNYAGTHPASATLEIPRGAGEDALRIVRARPGVLDAALRTRLGARVVLPDGRRAPFLLFVARASDPMRIAGFALEQGQWPPANGELLIERSSLAYFGLHAGQTVALELRNGRSAGVRIGGVVHDGALSPSTQEAVGYAYVTPELLARFGAAPVLNDLAIVVGEDGRASADVARIDAVAEDAGAALRAYGVDVVRIDAPPPFRHPHQSQMKTATALLLTFAQLALVLGAVLVATMLGGMLAQQTRQIGVMKALGARDRTIFTMYLLMTAAIAATATLLALVPGIAGARILARVVGDLFGIQISSAAVPPAVFATVIAAGIIVPVAIALVPLVRGTRITVREAIDGMTRGDAAFGTSRFQTWLARVPIGSRAVRLGLRNVARRPGRLVLVVLLLGASGAMYITALSTAAGMQAIVDQRMAYRHYDVDVRLSGPEDAARVAQLMSGAPAVTAFEMSSSTPVTTPHAGAIDVTRTYPDGGHGSFTITSMKPGGRFVELPVSEGHRLRDGEAATVVFNQLVIAQQQHDARVNHDVALSVDGKITRFRLVGIVRISDRRRRRTSRAPATPERRASKDGFRWCVSSRAATIAPDVRPRSTRFARASRTPASRCARSCRWGNSRSRSTVTPAPSPTSSPRSPS